MHQNNLLTCKEFEHIAQDSLSCKNRELVYKELEDIAKSDAGKDVISFVRNGKELQARNYVGTIQTKSGFTVEILPKIYKEDTEEGTDTKEIFLKLLQILYKLPNYKHTNSAKFLQKKMPLLEIFISMFLIEVEKIIKKGIKSDYLQTQDNLHFLKGKLLTSENLKKNYIHKEKFYVEFDEYSQNRVENRLIKSTLKYLLNISKTYENIRKIRIYQDKMQNIDCSSDINGDFRQIQTDTRGMEHYKQALIWAKIFLKKDSFCSFSGETIAFAILYPMEKLFESYVEHYLKIRYKKCDSVTVLAQVSKKDFVKNLFGIRPDIIIKKEENIIMVADAKWKMVDITDNKTFSQSDFYQLFAYKEVFKKESKNNIKSCIYYPMNENFTKIKYFQFFNDEKIMLVPLDLKKIIRNRHKGV